MNKCAAILALVIAVGTGAAQAALLSLPGGPLVLNVSTAEQYSASNDIDNPLNAAAITVGMPGTGNWGILQVDSILGGVERVPSGWQVDALGPTIFSDARNGGPQILGAFHDVKNNTLQPGTSTGGVLDLYYWSGGSQRVDLELGSAVNLSKRSADGVHYQGFTCQAHSATCTFLARLLFMPGADLGSSVNTVYSAFGSSSFEVYMGVDRSRIGAWTDQLDSNYFSLNPAQQACGPGVSCISANDFRADGRFTQSGASAWSVAGTDIVGLSKSGAIRAFVAEPGSLLLVGAALAAVALPRAGRKS